MRFVLTVCFAIWLIPAHSQGIDTQSILEKHIIPGYQTLADETAALADAAGTGCKADAPALISAYHNAFDAWVGISHLRFGPSDQNDRAFALAFWPDPRGSTPKALSGLIATQDGVVESAEQFASVSIAARGFYALEFLLFDPQFVQTDAPDYHCSLVRAVTLDISNNALAILQDWQNGYADLMLEPGNETYRTQAEAAQQLFTALTTGLEFTSSTRIGRPMGTFERPRPNRAEARRSGRSLRHVVLSLKATGGLAALITNDDAAIAKKFDAALERAKTLDDPVFAGVADPQGRLRVEVLQQSVDVIRRGLAEDVGPQLGIAAGFNSLDGD